MPAPTSPSYRATAERELLYNIESGAAGTPVLTGVFREPCLDFNWSPVRAVSRAGGYVGKMKSHFGADLTQQHADFTITVEHRAEGLSALASGIIMGNSTEVVTGAADPWTHTWTPSITAGRCNTLTLWMGMSGDTTKYRQLVKATITNISYSVTAEGSLVANITGSAHFPTIVDRATLTVSKFIGSTANYNLNRTMGSQGTYTIYSTAGTAYTNTILGLDFSLSRSIEILPNAQGTTPGDIATGELTVAVSNITAVYDGVGASSIYKDYLDYVEIGDSTHKHLLKWTDAKLHTYELLFWPAKWADGLQLDFSGEIVKINGGLEIYDDLATVNAASGAATAPTSLVIKNQLSTAMTS